MNRSTKIKRIFRAYIRLSDTLHAIISKMKNLKSRIREEKELVVDTVLSLEGFIPIDIALRVFGISRGTFENYKSIVIHKCNASYFKWSSKRYSNQLLLGEVRTIKHYLTNESYRHWSRSSIYLKALRDGNLKCALGTFYKYARLLGFNTKVKKQRNLNHSPLRTSAPNQFWCADVTVFRTSDSVKHYIHFLMDHFSRYVIGYKICSGPSPNAIKELLQFGYSEHRPEMVRFLTDGGRENVNRSVSGFIDRPEIEIDHLIAQRDVIFSNSMVEALNKVIKHQFLFPKELNNGKQLRIALERSVRIYNHTHPKMKLDGNTPFETFKGETKNFSELTQNFAEQKVYRMEINRKNSCKVCS